MQTHYLVRLTHNFCLSEIRMAVTKSMPKKAPTQNPVDFYQLKQQGGTHGVPTKVGDTLKSGAMREKIYGRKSLSKQ
jgi:hypothetical protein